MGLKPIRVSKLNDYIDQILKTDPILGNISVIGEISNLNFNRSGHIYFSLKDDSSIIRCMIFASRAESITVPLAEGMEIIVHGTISVYARGGYYSLIVKSVENTGIGQLAKAFEELKQKLDKEGLFKAEYKKPIPEFPGRIAVVTSSTGAAVQDILKIIQSRNDLVDVLVYPVIVQGPQAAPSIAAAIRDINENYKDVDVIIAGRGGGSMEDLWAFNEEVVARSIFASDIPVISAVGHETDFTIADFVADVRAETPTAAAAMAAPDLHEIREGLDHMKETMTRDILNKLSDAQRRLDAASPEAFATGIKTRIAFEQKHADDLLEAMTDAITARLKSSRQHINMLYEILETASPQKVLARGFSVVYDENGGIIRDASQMHAGDQIRIETAKGSARAEVIDSETN